MLFYNASKSSRFFAPRLFIDSRSLPDPKKQPGSVASVLRRLPHPDYPFGVIIIGIPYRIGYSTMYLRWETASWWVILGYHPKRYNVVAIVTPRY